MELQYSLMIESGENAKFHLPVKKFRSKGGEDWRIRATSRHFDNERTAGYLLRVRFSRNFKILNFRKNEIFLRAVSWRV